MHKPLISVVVPCYNQAQYLDECLQSVLDQTYPNWECIIVNDGSPDNTEEVAKKWLAKDARFKYYYKENGGLSSARNYGLDKSIGEFIQLLDCDDYLEHDKFTRQVDDLQSNDVSISDYMHKGTNPELIEQLYRSPFSQELFSIKDLLLDWETKLSIPCHCVLFKKTDLKFNEKLANHEDWVFWVQLFYKNKKIVYNRNVLAFYRYSPTSLSRNEIEMESGFYKACDYLYSYFKSKKENSLKSLILKKKEKLNKKIKMTRKEKIANFFPFIFGTYLKYIKQ